MANAVAEGAKSAGAEVDLLTSTDVAGVDGYDAVALGCPAMRSEELEDGEFLPMLEDIESALTGKKVALFGSYDWGVGEWLEIWEARCAAQFSQLDSFKSGNSNFMARPPFFQFL